MPDPVHKDTKQGRITHAKGFHADDGDVEPGHHENNQDIGKEKAWYGDEQVGQKSRRAVIDTAPSNGGPNPDREGERPGDDGAHDEKGEAVEEPFPDFREYRYFVLPRHDVAGEEVSVIVQVLNVERFVQMEFSPKTFYNLRRKLGVERIHLARLTRGEVDNQKRDNHHKEQGDDFLHNTATNK